MEVVISLLNKMLFLSFILSILVTLRHLFKFIRNVVSPDPTKIKLTSKEVFYLGVSVAYIITCLLNGFEL